MDRKSSLQTRISRGDFATTLQLTANDHIAFSIDGVHLKHRLGDVEADGRNRWHVGSSESWGPKQHRGTHVPVEEPSTVSIAEIVARGVDNRKVGSVDPSLVARMKDNISRPRNFLQNAGAAGLQKPQPTEALNWFELSTLRLLGVLGEREPPLGHFDEKRLMRRSASFLCQPNALGSIHAQLIQAGKVRFHYTVAFHVGYSSVTGDARDVIAGLNAALSRVAVLAHSLNWASSAAC
jgi:hypothetical protein